MSKDPLVEKVQTLDELYGDSSIYSFSNSTFSPPSEKLDHVIRFELTTGCSWNNCTFCDGYKSTPYRVKDLKEYKRHVDDVWKRIGKKSDIAKSLKRVFIGGGDALSVDADLLKKAIKYTKKKFNKNTGGYARRVALYGRTKGILEKIKYSLDNQGSKILNPFGRNPLGINLIYWGIESGSDDVLKYINKGDSSEEILEAAEILNRSFSRLRISTSVMVMPGLGGIRFYEDHMNKTAEVLGNVNPRFITFMGVNSSQDSLYSQKMKQEESEGTNRHLTEAELADQMIGMIDKLPDCIEGTTIGCFGPEIDKVAHNPLPFGSLTFYDEKLKQLIVESLRYKVAQTSK